jgi:hypothetical protein
MDQCRDISSDRRTSEPCAVLAGASKESNEHHFNFTLVLNSYQAAGAGWSTPFDHRDLQGVIQDQTRDNGINKYRKRLPPRQRHEFSYERQDGAYNGIRSERRHEGLAGQRRPEPVSLACGYHGKYGKVEQRKKAEGVEGIVVCGQTEFRPADSREASRQPLQHQAPRTP